MSEDIVIARHRQLCDLCGGIIHKHEKCRMIRDDFQQNIVRFEHLRCPGNPVTIETHQPTPKHPKNIYCNNAICFA